MQRTIEGIIETRRIAIKDGWYDYGPQAQADVAFLLQLQAQTERREDVYVAQIVALEKELRLALKLIENSSADGWARRVAGNALDNTPSEENPAARRIHEAEKACGC